MAQRRSWGSNRPARRKGYRVLRYWADLHDGRGYARRCMTVKGTRRDGDRVLAAIMAEHAGDRPTPTLRQVYERRWLADAEDRVADGSMTRTCLKQQESAWRTHVAPAFGDLPVPDIRPSDVQEWLLGMTASSARASLTLLQQVVTMAVKFDEVESRVHGIKYRMPRSGVKRDSGIWTLGELLDMWSALQGSPLLAPFVLCGFGGCRVGESLAVLGEEVRAVELDGLVYAVAPIVREMDNRTRFPVDRVKTEQSRREVAVPPPMSSALIGRTGWLSDRGTGDPTTQQQLRVIWKRECDRIGFAHHPFKNLRNSWRTWMASTGIPTEIVEKMMGHVGTTVTEVHYLKPTGEQFARELHRAVTGRLAGEWEEHLGKIG